MSWFLRLAPVMVVCACGGTTITREGNGGAGGKGAVGVDAGNGGAVGTTGGAPGTGGVAGGGKIGNEPMKHRATAVACGLPPAEDGGGSMGQSPPYEICMTNAECNSGPNGRCVPTRGGSQCAYDLCFADA